MCDGLRFREHETVQIHTGNVSVHAFDNFRAGHAANDPALGFHFPVGNIGQYGWKVEHVEIFDGWNAVVCATGLPVSEEIDEEGVSEFHILIGNLRLI